MLRRAREWEYRGAVAVEGIEGCSELVHDGESVGVVIRGEEMKLAGQIELVKRVAHLVAALDIVNMEAFYAVVNAAAEWERINATIDEGDGND